MLAGSSVQRTWIVPGDGASGGSLKQRGFELALGCGEIWRDVERWLKCRVYMNSLGQREREIVADLLWLNLQFVHSRFGVLTGWFRCRAICN